MAWLTRVDKSADGRNIAPYILGECEDGNGDYFIIDPDQFETLFPNGPRLEPGGGPVEVELVKSDVMERKDAIIEKLSRALRKSKDYLEQKKGSA